MTRARCLAVTARTAALLVAPQGLAYHRPKPLAWQLCAATSGARMAEGHSERAVIFLDDLTPATAYVLHTALGQLSFETPPCGGLIDPRDFGAAPDRADNAPAFQKAIAAVPDGGTLAIPAGRFPSGPIFLKPAMTLHLSKGAEIAAIGDRTGWPKLPAQDADGRTVGTWEGLPARTFAALVTAVDCDRLAVTGHGILDGGGDRGDWWNWPKSTRDGARRPRVLQIAHSRHVSLSGITVRNAPSWTVHPYRCDHLMAADLTIENPPDSPNTDGFNPESCEDVEIVGTRISVGDDCIAIKSGKRGTGQTAHLAPTRAITISHCHLARGHGAVVIGSEMSGSVTDVTISHCTFSDTDRGLRIKTRRGRGGTVRNIRMEHTDMTGVHTPIVVNAYYYCDPDGCTVAVQSRRPAPVGPETPQISDVTIEHVTATGARLAGAAILGLPEAPVRNLRLRNVRIDFDPDARPDIPLMALWVAPVAGIPMTAEFAEIDGEIAAIAPQNNGPQNTGLQDTGMSEPC